MKLNWGSSDNLHVDFLNVDMWEPPGAQPWDGTLDNYAGRFLKADLRKKLPLADSSCDEIRAHDIVEHLPSKIRTMNEIHRLLKPGGLLDLFVPTTDGRGAFQDPTHVSYWTPNDLWYYMPDFAEWQRFHVSSDITAAFRLLGQVRGATDCIREIELAHRDWGNKVWKLHITLVAVKETK